MILRVLRWKVLPRHRRVKALLAAIVVTSAAFLLLFCKDPHSLRTHSDSLQSARVPVQHNTISMADIADTRHYFDVMLDSPAKALHNISVHGERQTDLNHTAKEAQLHDNLSSRDTDVVNEVKCVSKAQEIRSSGLLVFPEHPTATVGGVLFVTCSVTPVLNASRVSFVLPDMSLLDDSAVQVTLKEGKASLVIHSVSRQHAGEYRCIASGDDDRSSACVPFKISVVDSKKLVYQKRFHNRVNLSRSETEELAKLTETLTTNRSAVLSNITALIERGKRQQVKVVEYCRKYDMQNISGVLPKEYESASALNRHTLLHDKRQVLFCFVPKVGCTNLKAMFLAMQGRVPLSQLVLSRDKLDQGLLEAAQACESFVSRTQQPKLFALRHYFKFVMYRNPLERLVSGFRSKVQRFPLVGLNDDSPHFNWLRKEIYLKERPTEYQQWLDDDGRTAVNITFKDFIGYFLSQPVSLKHNEHFQSISSMCQPCRVQYNFYGNFKHFDNDADVLIERMHGHSAMLRSGYYSSADSTQTIAPGYYAELSFKQRLGVLHLLAQELDFYYHVFPEEQDSHKRILSVSKDLP